MEKTDLATPAEKSISRNLFDGLAPPSKKRLKILVEDAVLGDE
jgi:hypothetical protein